MDLDSLIQEHIVFGINQKHSERIAEVKKFAWQVMTGEGQEEWVSKYRRNETDAQKEQRNNIYTNLTKYVTARPRKYWKKIGRTDGIKVTIEAADTKKLDQVNSNFSNFYGGRSLIEYLNWKLEYCQFFTPNSFSIYERSDTRDESGEILETVVYPIVVPSENVINAIYANGNLTVLVVQYPRTKAVLDEGNQPQYITLIDYVAYKAGETVEYREYESQAEMREAGGEPIAIKDSNHKNRYFSRFEYDTGTTEIPAITNGAYRDEETNQETNVTPFEPATDVFIDLIKNKSLLDVSVIAHVFLKKFAYVKPCTYAGEEGVCKGGFINGVHGATCPVCQGSGKAPVHTTDQEVIELAMPETAEELLELAKLTHYETLPMEIVNKLHELVLEAEERVLKAIFNKNIFDREQINKTATEVKYEYEELYDVLKPYADLISAHYEKAHRLAAQYLEIGDFNVSHQFPKDFKMKSITELVTELELMTRAGAGFDAIESVRRDILQKQHANNPTKIAMIEAREAWRPLADKSPELATAILMGKNPKDFHRVLFEHFNEIFTEIEAEHPKFYEYNYEKQKGIVENMVMEFAGGIIEAIEPLNFENVE